MMKYKIYSITRSYNQDDLRQTIWKKHEYDIDPENDERVKDFTKMKDEVRNIDGEISEMILKSYIVDPNASYANYQMVQLFGELFEYLAYKMRVGDDYDDIYDIEWCCIDFNGLIYDYYSHKIISNENYIPFANAPKKLLAKVDNMKYKVLRMKNEDKDC